MTTTMIMAQFLSARKLGSCTPNQLVAMPLKRPWGCSSIFQTSTLATMGVTTGMKKRTRRALRPRILGPSPIASSRDKMMLAGT